jgi:hypothetical protein
VVFSAFAGAIEMIVTASPAKKSDEALMAVSSDFAGQQNSIPVWTIVRLRSKKLKLNKCGGSHALPASGLRRDDVPRGSAPYFAGSSTET